MRSRRQKLPFLLKLLLLLFLLPMKATVTMALLLEMKAERKLLRLPRRRLTPSLALLTCWLSSALRPRLKRGPVQQTRRRLGRGILIQRPGQQHRKCRVVPHEHS